ncbi:ABC transporter permease [Lentibacillus sediminis]|uniref:ABC transporter permease n=1 Tax=Lentibacillus sediminis TaxID=1940529 RepID=UPI000C1C40B5|nr:ABC transporter permease subunit [Lentibacillus sediminis]
MINLILFEIRKVFKSTFFRILMLAFLLFLITYYILVYTNTVHVENEVQQMEEFTDRQEQDLQEKRELLESAEGTEAEQLEEQIEFQKNMLEEDKQEIEWHKEENWEALLQPGIKREESAIASMRYNNQTHTYTWQTLFTKETFVAKSKWMIDKEVTPLLPVGSTTWITWYDQDINVQGATPEEALQWNRETADKYSSASIHYLDRLYGLMFSIFGAVFFLFLFGDVMTKEGLGRNGSIHLLQTQPIHRDKILAGKFLAVGLLSFLILLGAVLFAVITGVIFDRFGDLAYPVMIYGEDRTFSLMGMGMFLLRAAGMFGMILLFCYSMLFLFSIITKRMVLALGVTLGVLYIGVTWSGEMINSSIAHYLPFQYFSVFDIMTNELALTVENWDLTYANGMISLSVSSFLILLATYGAWVVQYRRNG